MNRLKKATALAAGLLLAATGCGGGAADTDPDKLSGEVTMWIPPIGGDAESGYWKDKVKDFNKEHPKVDVTVVVQPWEKRSEKMLTAIAGKAAPDVAYFIPDEVPKYVENRVLAEVGDLISDRDDFRPNALQGFTVDDKLYAVPTLMTATTTLYNKKVLDAAGVSEPRTWDDVRAAASKIKKAGYFVTQYDGAATMTLNGSFYPLLWQAGGEILNEKGDQAAFNGDAGVKALEFAKWLVDNGHTPKDAITTELKAETSPLAQGKVAMTFSRSLASLEQSGLSTESLLVGPPLKDAAQASFGTVGGYARFQTSKHPEAADAWIKWITSADHLKEYLPDRNFYSPRRSVTGLYEPGTPVAEVEAYLDQMNVGLIHPQSREIMDLIKPHLQSALLGKKRPRAALDAAAKEVNELLARG